MLARSFAGFAVAFALVGLAPALARADVPNEGCEGLDAGDACEDGFDVGTCQEVDGSLECVIGGATTGAATTGATTSAATTSAATTSASSGSSGGGDEGGSGGSAGGGETEDDGCAVRARGKRTTHVGAAAIFVLALGISVVRRLRRA